MELEKPGNDAFELFWYNITLNKASIQISLNNKNK